MKWKVKNIVNEYYGACWIWSQLKEINDGDGTEWSPVC